MKRASTFRFRRNLLSPRSNFTVSGQGDFEGTFRFFKGGRELKGTFTSPEAGVNAWRFPDVHGLADVATGIDRVTDVTPASTAGPRGSTTGWSRSARQASRDGDLGRQILRRRPRRGSPTFSRPGHPSRRPRDRRNRSSGRSASGRLKHGGGTVRRRRRPARADDAADPAARIGRGTAAVPRPGRSTRAAIGYVPIARQRSPTPSIRMDHHRPEPDATEKTYVEFKGRTVWGAAIEDSVPRHQPRLAGERPRARRHHDGVRLADRRDRRSAAAASSTA